MNVGMAGLMERMREGFTDFVFAVGIVLIFPAILSAQTGVPTAAAMPKTTTSARDLSGVWIAQGAQSLSLLPTGRHDLPMTAWGKSHFMSAKPVDPQKPNGGATADDPHRFCDPVGMPRADLTMRPIEIVQADDEVYVFYEEDHS